MISSTIMLFLCFLKTAGNIMPFTKHITKITTSQKQVKCHVAQQFKKHKKSKFSDYYYIAE